MTAATLLRQARRAADLSQRDLAARAKTNQPNIAVVESGRRDPLVDTLDHLLHATGHRLALIPARAPTAADVAGELAETRRRAPGSGRDSRALRQLIGFSDALTAQPPDIRVALCVTRPAPSGDRRYDAALAALVDHHLGGNGLPVPAWADPGLTRSEEPWAPSPFVDPDVDDIPEAFRRRNILLAASELESV
jgi:transcriptional regulator with XRE-family HTH domain